MIQISVHRKFDSHLLVFFSSDIKGTIIQETLVIYEVCVSDVGHTDCFSFLYGKEHFIL